jgi:hypothetical protein
MKCPGGRLLTNANVVSLFQACFRIGHYQTERGKGVSGAARRPPRGALGRPAGRRAVRQVVHCSGCPACAFHALGFACGLSVAGKLYANPELAHVTCSTSPEELRDVRSLGERRATSQCRRTRAC